MDARHVFQEIIPERRNKKDGKMTAAVYRSLPKSKTKDNGNLTKNQRRLNQHNKARNEPPDGVTVVVRSLRRCGDNKWSTTIELTRNGLESFGRSVCV